MDDLLPAHSSEKSGRRAAADVVAYSFAVIGGAAAGFTTMFWPDKTTVDDSVGIRTIVWIFAGAGLGVLGLIGAMIPALVMLVKTPSKLSFGLLTAGLFILIIGIITLTKWQAVSPLGHGP